MKYVEMLVGFLRSRFGRHPYFAEAEDAFGAVRDAVDLLGDVVDIAGRAVPCCDDPGMEDEWAAIDARLTALRKKLPDIPEC